MRAAVDCIEGKGGDSALGDKRKPDDSKDATAGDASKRFKGDTQPEAGASIAKRPETEQPEARTGMTVTDLGLAIPQPQQNFALKGGTVKVQQPEHRPLGFPDLLPQAAFDVSQSLALAEAPVRIFSLTCDSQLAPFFSNCNMCSILDHTVS